LAQVVLARIVRGMAKGKRNALQEAAAAKGQRRLVFRANQLHGDDAAQQVVDGGQNCPEANACEDRGEMAASEAASPERCRGVRSPERVACASEHSSNEKGAPARMMSSVPGVQTPGSGSDAPSLTLKRKGGEEDGDVDAVESTAQKYRRLDRSPSPVHIGPAALPRQTKAARIGNQGGTAAQHTPVPPVPDRTEQHTLAPSPPPVQEERTVQQAPAAPPVPPVQEERTVQHAPPVPPAQEERTEQQAPAAPPVQEERTVQHAPPAPPAQEERTEQHTSLPPVPPVQEERTVQHPPPAPPALEERTEQHAPPAQEERAEQHAPPVPPVQEERTEQHAPPAPPVQGAMEKVAKTGFPVSERLDSLQLPGDAAAKQESSTKMGVDKTRREGMAAKISSLRQRLAAKRGSGLHDMPGQAEMANEVKKAPENRADYHKNLGMGMALRWQLTFEKEESERLLPERLPQSPAKVARPSTPHAPKPGVVTPPSRAGKVAEADNSRPMRTCTPTPPPRHNPQKVAASAEGPDEDQRGGKGELSSVKELRAMLTQHGISCRDCLEKADLEARWQRFEELRSRPLRTLRALCAKACAEGLLQSDPSAEECARHLMQPPRKTVSSDSLASSHGSSTSSIATLNPVAASLVQRIHSLDQSAFRSKASWGFAVLDTHEHTLPAVQKAHRNHMRVLHPDKIMVNTAEVSDAIEMLRQARQACEQGLSMKDPPATPARLRGTVLCSTAGQRRIRIEWQPYGSNKAMYGSHAPLQRYIIAAMNPEFGRVLPVATLESEYSQEQQKFIPIEEISSHVLAEEELLKMAWLFNRPSTTVQVAAANEAGQSSWAVLQVQMPQGLASRGPGRRY